MCRAALEFPGSEVFSACLAHLYPRFASRLSNALTGDLFPEKNANQGLLALLDSIGFAGKRPFSEISKISFSSTPVGIALHYGRQAFRGRTRQRQKKGRQVCADSLGQYLCLRNREDHQVP